MKDTDGSDFIYMLLHREFLVQLNSQVAHDLDWLNGFRCNVDMKALVALLLLVALAPEPYYLCFISIEL